MIFTLKIVRALSRIGIWGGGGGRRGTCRAHKIIILRHMTQGWIQDLEKGGHKGVCTKCVAQFLK